MKLQRVATVSAVTVKYHVKNRPINLPLSAFVQYLTTNHHINIKTARTTNVITHECLNFTIVEVAEEIAVDVDAEDAALA